MQKFFNLLVVVVVLSMATATPTLPPHTVRVHIVPHSHDDVGWLKTADEYFFGRNNSIQHACVELIYDSVVNSLSQHEDRKFTAVEMYFFSKWYYRQTKEKQTVVRQLIANKQLQFANGGWSMHDEATTFYQDMIDQTTLGHQFLLRELGSGNTKEKSVGDDNIRPSDGWQIDPFGHSAGQIMLFSQAAGFNTTFHSRIDYQDFSHRQFTQAREYMWSPSPSLGEHAEVFASSMLHSTYCPQYTLNFMSCSPQIQFHATMRKVACETNLLLMVRAVWKIQKVGSIE